ncbi:LOW QUALITY PROTEIN: hypothetical protein M8C21_015392, partial [Ambrosia artemisiifolia]
TPSCCWGLPCQIQEPGFIPTSALSATKIKTSRIPIISNADAQPHAHPETIKKTFTCQTTMKTLLSRGLEKSYEFGPGKFKKCSNLNAKSEDRQNIAH